MKERKWILLIFLLAGLVIGGLIGEIASRTSSLWWINYGQTFGLTHPILLDLKILTLTFGFTIKITVASIIGMILALIIYSYTR